MVDVNHCLYLLSYVRTCHTLLSLFSAVARRYMCRIALPLLIIVGIVIFLAYTYVKHTELSETRSTFVSSSVIEVDHGVNHFGLVFSGWFVSQCVPSPLEVYCVAHNLSYLSTKRVVNNVSAPDVFIMFNRTIFGGPHTLPLSSRSSNAFHDYLLQGSEVMLHICPSSTIHDNLQHTITFFIFTDLDGVHDLLNDDYNEAFLYAKEIIDFKYGDPCKMSVIPMTRSSFVYFGMFTSESVFVDVFSGSMKKLAYSAKELGLLTDKNKLSPQPKISNGTDADSILVCSAPDSEGHTGLCVADIVEMNFVFYLFLASTVCLAFVSVLALCGCHYCPSCSCSSRSPPRRSAYEPLQQLG